MVETKQTHKIPVRKLAKGEFRRRLTRSVRKYERRYETESSLMCDMLRSRHVRETSELIKWMFDFHALLDLDGKTHTTGTHRTTTVQSTTAD